MRATTCNKATRRHFSQSYPRVQLLRLLAVMNLLQRQAVYSERYAYRDLKKCMQKVSLTLDSPRRRSSALYMHSAGRLDIRQTIQDKATTTMVIRVLDDPTAVLIMWSPIYDPSVWGILGDRLSSFGSPPMYSY